MVMKLSAKQLAVSLSLVAIGGGAGLLGSRYLPQSRSYNQFKNVTVALPPEAVINRPVEKSAGGSQRGEMNFIASAVQKTGSAVVRINATRKVANPLSKALKHPLLRRFFGEDEQPLPLERNERRTGSGIILSDEGK